MAWDRGGAHLNELICVHCSLIGVGVNCGPVINGSSSFTEVKSNCRSFLFSSTVCFFLFSKIFLLWYKACEYELFEADRKSVV